ncbi:MAG: FAD-dependent oxidoreductase [Armatimonadetes bacterium]|nr:FAD-dependent oxidoreductase [Armatimonadota bacterium]
MRVAIVGAGISGLAVAWRLERAGVTATVFEKSSKVGGRASTVVIDGYTFDDGATSIAPRGRAIEEVLLKELPTDDLVRIEKPIWVHDSLRVSAGSIFHNETSRYTYSTGLAEFPNRLATPLKVKTMCEVADIASSREGFEIQGEMFDNLVLALPLPLTSQLLWSLNESRPLSNVSYRSCLSVMLGFKNQLHETPYHAIVDPEGVHPMQWLSLESEKSPRRAPEHHTAMVMQLSPRFSKDNFDKSDEFIVSTALAFTKNLYGPEFETAEVAQVKRWKYSQPENLARFEAVNQPGSRVLVASDALLGGRIEEAFECGYRVGELLLNA